MSKYDAIMDRLQARFVRERKDHLPYAEERLVRLETELGIPIPADYREFVSAWGMCGFRKKVTFPIQGDPPFGGAGLLDVFYGLSNQYNLETEVEDYQGRLPPGLIPVAQDPGGNQICLALEGPERGSVFFWYQDYEGEPKATWLIAKSWDEFMHLLKPYVPE